MNLLFARSLLLSAVCCLSLLSQPHGALTLPTSSSSNEEGEVLPMGRQIPVNTSQQTVRAQLPVEFVQIDFSTPGSAAATAAEVTAEAGTVRQTRDPQEDINSDSSFFSSFDGFSSPTIAFSRRTRRPDERSTYPFLDFFTSDWDEEADSLFEGDGPDEEEDIFAFPGFLAAAPPPPLSESMPSRSLRRKGRI